MLVVFGGLWWLGLDGDFFFQVFENDGAILNFSLLGTKNNQLILDLVRYDLLY